MSGRLTKKAFEVWRNSGLNPNYHLVETTDMIIAIKLERKEKKLKMLNEGTGKEGTL